MLLTYDELGLPWLSTGGELAMDQRSIWNQSVGADCGRLRDGFATTSAALLEITHNSVYFKL